MSFRQEITSASELAKQLVKEVETASMLLQTPDELREAWKEVMDDDMDDMIDFFQTTFTFMDGPERVVVFDIVAAMELYMGLASWLEGIHESGRCGCQSHD